jgi:hypothetical protein
VRGSPTGSRFSPLAAVEMPERLLEVEGASDLERDLEDTVGEEEGSSPTIVSLGSFLDPPWSTAGAAEPAPSQNSPGSICAAPSPPLLGELDFPPLPYWGMPRPGPLPSLPARWEPEHLDGASFRVGDLAIPLPTAGASSMEFAPPLTAPVREPGPGAGDETLAGLLGPRGRGSLLGRPRWAVSRQAAAGARSKEELRRRICSTWPHLRSKGQTLRFFRIFPILLSRKAHLSGGGSLREP